ncbi:Aldo/keto reductase [Athelia psychrophila]|uniref:Aldo/keto reductase n=1 Tax=Athelia psychrophila TaxID=1759441 RepID=A0A166GZZ9_9AGAM|nr:Aldo/keto reductase [Fibularhizoctonia sp. CBS 109695]
MGFSHHRGPAKDEESLKTLGRAVELGCTFWDTATVYGYGHNEALIGQFFKENPGSRDKVFVGSKCGLLIDYENKRSLEGNSNSPAHINESIEGTIERLGTAPDLYYLHRIDPDTPLEESIPALAALKAAGKCKYIGLCETSAATLRKACSIAHIDALQIEYSLWFTDHERNGLLDAARELGVAIIAYSPLGRGVLTGQYRDVAAFSAPGDNRAMIPKYSAEFLPGNLRLVDEIEKLATKKGCTPGQLSIAWVAAQGAIPIPGTKTSSRLEENWGSREVGFTEAELEEIRVIITEAAPKGARYDPVQLKAVGI